MKLYEELGLTNVEDKEVTLLELSKLIELNNSKKALSRTRVKSDVISSLFKNEKYQFTIKVSDIDKYVYFDEQCGIHFTDLYKNKRKKIKEQVNPTECKNKRKKIKEQVKPTECKNAKEENKKLDIYNLDNPNFKCDNDLAMKQLYEFIIQFNEKCINDSDGELAKDFEANLNEKKKRKEGKSMDKENFSIDKNGNLTHFKSLVSNHEEFYEYNDDSKLTHFSKDGMSINIQYDDNGNIIHCTIYNDYRMNNLNTVSVVKDICKDIAVAEILDNHQMTYLEYFSKYDNEGNIVYCKINNDVLLEEESIEPYEEKREADKEFIKSELEKAKYAESQPHQFNGIHNQNYPFGGMNMNPEMGFGMINNVFGQNSMPIFGIGEDAESRELRLARREKELLKRKAEQDAKKESATTEEDK